MTRAALIAAADAIRSGAMARHPWPERLKLAGIGWATVELERAALDPTLVCGAWEAAARDPLLGARVWRCVDEGDDSDDGVAVLLLEPDTEGRIAASLARFGEGVGAIYLAGDTAPAGVSGPADGPLGVERMLLGGPPWGPHVVVLEATNVEPPAVRS